MENYKEKIDKDGYLVIPDVFSSEEIDKIALRIESCKENTLISGENKKIQYAQNSNKESFVVLNDLLSRPELEDFDWIALNDRIVNIMQKLINGPLCYFGESSAHIGAGHRGFHKDNISRDNINHDDWKSNYDVFRMGLYAQDTESYSGGLQIRKKSHLKASRWIGWPKTLRVKKGSIIIWKLTLTHSGNTLLPRFFPSFPYLLPRLTSMMPHWFFRPYERSRIALFISYGATNSKHTKNYIEYRKTREDWYTFEESLKINKVAEKRSYSFVKFDKIKLSAFNTLDEPAEPSLHVQVSINSLL